MQDENELMDQIKELIEGKPIYLTSQVFLRLFVYSVLMSKDAVKLSLDMAKYFLDLSKELKKTKQEMEK